VGSCTTESATNARSASTRVFEIVRVDAYAYLRFHERKPAYVCTRALREIETRECGLKFIEIATLVPKETYA